MLHEPGGVGDAYCLALARGRKPRPSRYGSNLQVKCVDPAERKAILQCHTPVNELRVEDEEWGPSYAGSVCRLDDRLKRAVSGLSYGRD